jgi:hypothetical protein
MQYVRFGQVAVHVMFLYVKQPIASRNGIRRVFRELDSFNLVVLGGFRGICGCQEMPRR